MVTGDPNLPFFVKVEGQAFSNHRNPQGIYRVEVKPEKTVAHSAFAALQVAKESVPFLNENVDYFTLRAFLEDGREVVIPRPLITAFEDHGRFMGRSDDHPDIITIQ